MKTAVAVFCKTPGLSPVKTRLGQELGNPLAEEFYNLSVMAIDEVLEKATKESEHSLEVYWAVAEQEGLSNPMWKSHRRIWTGEGGLGMRIDRVFRELFMKYEQVIIMGSDSPQMTTSYIHTAVKQLQSPDLDGVIGPCLDGGFVLFGSNKLLDAAIWTKVIYSRKDTLQQLTDLIGQTGYRYHMLPGLGDVDQYDDLLLLLQDLTKQYFVLQPSQRFLYQKVQNLLTSMIFLHELHELPDRDQFKRRG